MIRETIVAVALVAAVTEQGPNREPLLNPDHPGMQERAPDVCRILLDTTKGPITLEMRREWAPRGVDRFYNLVRAGFYDEARSFASARDSGRSSASTAIRRLRSDGGPRTIPDDPRVLSNFAGRWPMPSRIRTAARRRSSSTSATTAPRTTWSRSCRSPGSSTGWTRPMRSTRSTGRAPAAGSEQGSRIRCSKEAMPS